MKINILISTFIILIFSISTWADASITISNEAVIPIKGMVCSLCAQGIEKKFKAQDAIEKVTVSLEEHKVHLIFKKDKSLNNNEIETILKNAGYGINGEIIRK